MKHFSKWNCQHTKIDFYDVHGGQLLLPSVVWPHLLQHCSTHIWIHTTVAASQPIHLQWNVMMWLQLPIRCSDDGNTANLRDVCCRMLVSGLNNNPETSRIKWSTSFFVNNYQSCSKNPNESFNHSWIKSKIELDLFYFKTFMNFFRLKLIPKAVITPGDK